MTIAVDFDGTIVTHAYPKIGREIPGAIDTLKRLQRDGHRLILWTAREGDLLKEAVKYCRSKGLEFFAVNEHYAVEPRHDCGRESKACRKLTADLYIDDRNLGGFPGWEAIYEMVSKRMSSADYFYEVINPHKSHCLKSILRRIFGPCFP